MVKKQLAYKLFKLETPPNKQNISYLNFRLMFLTMLNKKHYNNL